MTNIKVIGLFLGIVLLGIGVLGSTNNLGLEYLLIGISGGILIGFSVGGFRA